MSFVLRREDKISDNLSLENLIISEYAEDIDLNRFLGVWPHSILFKVWSDLIALSHGVSLPPQLQELRKKILHWENEAATKYSHFAGLWELYMEVFDLEGKVLALYQEDKDGRLKQIKDGPINMADMGHFMGSVKENSRFSNTSNIEIFNLGDLQFYLEEEARFYEECYIQAREKILSELKI